MNSYESATQTSRPTLFSDCHRRYHSVSSNPLQGDVYPSRLFSTCFTCLSNVLVSAGCHNKIPQPGRLKTTHLFLTVLQAGRPRSRCWQVWSLSPLSRTGLGLQPARLDWGWRAASVSGVWQPGADGGPGLKFLHAGGLHRAGSSTGCLGVLRERWLASFRSSDPRASEPGGSLSFSGPTLGSHIAPLLPHRVFRIERLGAPTLKESRVWLLLLKNFLAALHGM